MLGKLLNGILQKLSISPILLWLFSLLATLGFIDSVYLTIDHYTHGIVPCYVGSCETVLTSSYANGLFGIPIPVAVLGVIFYFSVLVLLMVYFDSKNKIALLLALLATSIGVLASGYFIYLQADVIGAWCQYCLFSAFTSTTMFVIALLVTTKIWMNSSSTS
ncbi:MAG: Vitamin epoxide reductase [Parcubacteria group bacterium]|nr:Vitamin epoxide reductase [Parcubacteria group bacterium]